MSVCLFIVYLPTCLPIRPSANNPTLSNLKTVVLNILDNGYSPAYIGVSIQATGSIGAHGFLNPLL